MSLTGVREPFGDDARTTSSQAAELWSTEASTARRVVSTLAAARRRFQRGRDRFYRWAVLPGDRWENREQRLCGWVVALHRNSISLEITRAPSAIETVNCSEPPGDSGLIVTIEASDRRWRPIP